MRPRLLPQMPALWRHAPGTSCHFCNLPAVQKSSIAWSSSGALGKRAAKFERGAACGDTTMRKEFVMCQTRSMAARKCPWAVVIAAVDGGFMCFESRDDYQMWKRQT
jgi:hypothetical protein